MNDDLNIPEVESGIFGHLRPTDVKPIVFLGDVDNPQAILLQYVVVTWKNTPH